MYVLKFKGARAQRLIAGDAAASECSNVHKIYEIVQILIAILNKLTKFMSISNIIGTPSITMHKLLNHGLM
jgi:hypothetical protein